MRPVPQRRGPRSLRQSPQPSAVQRTAARPSLPSPPAEARHPHFLPRQQDSSTSPAPCPRHHVKVERGAPAPPSFSCEIRRGPSVRHPPTAYAALRVLCPLLAPARAPSPMEQRVYLPHPFAAHLRSRPASHRRPACSP